MASRRQDIEIERPAPRLYVVTPPVETADDWQPALALALDAADVAAVLVRIGGDENRKLVERIRTLAPVVQNRDAALLLGGHPDIALKAGADGAHLTGIEDFEAAVGILKPDLIAGAGGLTTRHDAMLAAEGGADYVMFGDPGSGGHRPSFEQIVERVAWWSEIFQMPCVGYAASFEEIAPLVAAGADFVAVGEFVFSDERGAAASIAACAALLATEPVE